MQTANKRARRRRGVELIEFAFVTTFLLPVLFGTFVVGMNLGRSIQVTQLSRDAGHMYGRGVDFSLNANKDLVVRLAQGLNITRTGGQGVVILSTVTYIGQAQCQAAGGACANQDRYVFTQRIVIGNASARASAFGAPNSGLLDASGRVSNYLNETSARANGFGNVLTLQPGEVAFVSEVYFPSSDYGMPGFESTGVYCRSVF